MKQLFVAVLEIQSRGKTVVRVQIVKDAKKGHK
jgi:hypothetical protein